MECEIKSKHQAKLSGTSKRLGRGGCRVWAMPPHGEVGTSVNWSCLLNDLGENRSRQSSLSWFHLKPCSSFIISAAAAAAAAKSLQSCPTLYSPNFVLSPASQPPYLALVSSPSHLTSFKSNSFFKVWIQLLLLFDYCSWASWDLSTF